MDVVDLTNKACPDGHTDLHVVSQRNDCYIVECRDCGWRGYEHDLINNPIEEGPKNE